MKKLTLALKAIYANRKAEIALVIAVAAAVREILSAAGY